MSKELETLEKLRQNNIDNSHLFDDELLDTIESALKRLEELEKAFIALSKEDEKAKKLLSKEIEKNRALEIIKKKDVSMYWLRHSKSVNDYNNFILTDKRQYQKLNQEEYDLLKEVLL